MRRVCLVGLLGLLLLAGRSTFGDDQAKTSKKAEPQKHTANKPVAGEKVTATTNETKATPTPHWSSQRFEAPNFIVDRAKLQAVMDKYAGPINQLEAQIRELKMKREKEILALYDQSREKILAEVKRKTAESERMKAAPSQTAPNHNAGQQAVGQEKTQDGNAKVTPKEYTKAQSQSHRPETQPQKK